MTSDSPSEVLKARPNDEPWTPADAAHLLRRAQFGASASEIDQATAGGMHATIERLVGPQQESTEFLQAEGILRRAAISLESIDDLKAWWMYRMRYSANPLVEKMTLFWHNHFATSYVKVKSPALMAAQNDLLRRCALGSFRDLLGGIARDVAMLIWLDGNANKKRHANENFAREVMELFSLGVGHYSETDIAEAARAFTGWHVRDDEFWFNSLHHDFGGKSVLGQTGKFDGDDIIEICLEQPACPRFLATKLLKTFVVSEPEADAIDAVARRVRAHDFRVRSVMGDLFRSEYFYRDEHRHALIKSPVELVLGAHRELNTRPDLAGSARLCAQLGQDLFQPPTVKGWDGGRLWINSATLLQRANFAAELVHGEDLGTLPDPITLAVEHGWSQPAQAVEFFSRLMLGELADPGIIDRLKKYLLQSPDENASGQLKGLVHLIMTLPEYQLV